MFKPMSQETKGHNRTSSQMTLRTPAMGCIPNNMQIHITWMERRNTEPTCQTDNKHPNTNSGPKEGATWRQRAREQKPEGNNAEERTAEGGAGESTGKAEAIGQGGRGKRRGWHGAGPRRRRKAEGETPGGTEMGAGQGAAGIGGEGRKEEEVGHSGERVARSERGGATLRCYRRAPLGACHPERPRAPWRPPACPCPAFAPPSVRPSPAWRIAASTPSPPLSAPGPRAPFQLALLSPPFTPPLARPPLLPLPPILLSLLTPSMSHPVLSRPVPPSPLCCADFFRFALVQVRHIQDWGVVSSA